MMRNLEECKSEVFRRSRERIKARRRARKRVAARCIAFCLCLAIPAVILSAIMPVTEDGTNGETAPGDGAEKERVPGDGAIGSVVCSYDEVEIQDMTGFFERDRKITDKADVESMFRAIDGLYHGENTSLMPGDQSGHTGSNSQENNSQKDHSQENLYQAVGSGSKVDYVILFSARDGLQRTYTLKGNTLLDESTGECLQLTGEQLARLKGYLP